MRVTSELYVSALVRRVFAGGGFAAVERHGSREAGAVFLRQRFRDGLETLYGPAPQSAFGEDDDDRRFELRLERGEVADCDAIIAREARFDPDLWVVELEIEDVAGLFPVTDA